MLLSLQKPYISSRVLTFKHNLWVAVRGPQKRNLKSFGINFFVGERCFHCKVQTTPTAVPPPRRTEGLLLMHSKVNVVHTFAFSLLVSKTGNFPSRRNRDELLYTGGMRSIKCHKCHKQARLIDTQSIYCHT